MARPSPATRDNSGLIDLRALMAASQSAERAPPASTAESTPVPVVDNIDVYPLGAPEAAGPAPPAPAEQVAQRRTSRTSTAIAVLGGVALVGAVTGVLLLARSPRGAEGPPSAGAAAGELAVAPTETQAPPRVEPTPPREPEKPADSTAPPADTTSAKTPPKTPPAKTPPAKTPPVKTPPVKTPPVKAPPASPCNGDLLCEMQRSVKH